MSTSIEKNFNTFSLLRFAFPSMIMMVFLSLYTIIDGIFISYFVGDAGLSASNITYPAISVILAIGIMLGTGGCAVVAKQMGEGNFDNARNSFSFLIFVSFSIGMIVLVFGNLFISPLLKLLGSTPSIFHHCVTYLKILFYFAPACMLQLMFQSFFVAAGKPGIGLGTTVAGGVTNAVLDYVFMGPLHMGIAGAGLATGLGQLVPALTGVIFFFVYRKGLYFIKFHADMKVLLFSCFNGSSEMVTNLSTSVVTYLFNIIMLHLAGETGVAAITIILYGQFLFNALFMGYSMGVAPVISFNYGKKDYQKLYKIYRICIHFILLSSILITGFAILAGPFVVEMFTPPATTTFRLAKRGFVIFSFCFLFAGLNIFTSSMFTALSDGKTSAWVSFLRTFGFLVASILILPLFLRVDGVWLAVPVAEFLTSFIAFYHCHKWSRSCNLAINLKA